MKPYVLTFERPDELTAQFKKIGVDAGGCDIMLPKAFLRCVMLHRLPSFSANILKQEMLSLGGDAAVSRGSLTASRRKTDCLLMGNRAQFAALEEKLKRQPFGLSRLGREIKCVFENFQKETKVFKFGARKICFENRTAVMGIINASFDSFSGDGAADAGKAFARAEAMVAQGADMLDIGGESSRPGSRRISTKEESSRVLPLLKKIAKKIKVPISVDTMKSEVARAALDAGASIINDISALRYDKKMAKLAARTKAGVILTHMKGVPLSMQKNPVYADVTGEIAAFFSATLARAQDAGISDEALVVDPGIGFGKTLAHNLEILAHLDTLKSFGRPILVGLSRKAFLGRILHADAGQRVWGTAAALALSIAGGADIVRVHDVGEMAQVARVADAIVRQRDLRGV